MLFSSFGTQSPLTKRRALRYVVQPEKYPVGRSHAISQAGSLRSRRLPCLHRLNGVWKSVVGSSAWSLDEAASRALVRHAIDAGINFFDTANLYSNGGSEEIVGRALKDFINRDAVVIATKVSAATRNGPNATGLSRKATLAEIDHSLRRLGTDCIDLYQIHRRDQLTPWEETLEALHDLVKMGKVRYIGASSMKAWELGKALHLQAANGWSRFISMQQNYNLIARREEGEMIPLCSTRASGR